MSCALCGQVHKALLEAPTKCGRVMIAVIHFIAPRITFGACSIPLHYTSRRERLQSLFPRKIRPNPPHRRVQGLRRLNRPSQERRECALDGLGTGPSAHFTLSWLVLWFALCTPALCPFAGLEFNVYLVGWFRIGQASWRPASAQEATWTGTMLSRSPAQGMPSGSAPVMQFLDSDPCRPRP